MKIYYFFLNKINEYIFKYYSFKIFWRVHMGKLFLFENIPSSILEAIINIEEESKKYENNSEQDRIIIKVIRQAKNELYLRKRLEDKQRRENHATF